MEPKKIPELSFDLQRVMLHVLIQLLHSEGLAKSQNAFASEIGASKAQVSLAMTRLTHELRQAGGVLVAHNHGVEGVLDLLEDVDQQQQSFGTVGDDDEILPRLFKRTFSPKVGWETFLSRLLPDIWPLPWAQELWQIRKMDGWLRGRAGSEITASRVALTVMDAVFGELRVPHWAIQGWKEVSDHFSCVLPDSIRRSIYSEEECAVSSPIGPDWFVHDHGQTHHGKMVLRWVMEQLEQGMSPAFHVEDVLWIVHRVRLHRGKWLLDCWSDGGLVVAFDAEHAPDKNASRSLPHRQPPGVIKFFSYAVATPPWLDHADGLECVDNPHCQHLGLTRGEVFLLDCAPTLNWLQLRTRVPGTGLDVGKDVANDLPEGWTTRRIYPRYTKCHASDPAWVEFVSILLPYAGQIRLRTPEHSEIEGHPMLTFCTGAIDERLLLLA